MMQNKPTTEANNQWLIDLATRAIIRQIKNEDSLVLTDTVLQKLLQGQAILTKSGWQKLMSSPLTMRRLQRVQSQLKADAIKTTQVTTHTTSNTSLDDKKESLSFPTHFASNRVDWTASTGLLRAAASGLESETQLTTDDGVWQLHILPNINQGWNLMLRLNEQSSKLNEERANSHLNKYVAVLDSKGTTLMHGYLDSDAELEVVWPLEQSPLDWLKTHGGGFVVESS